MRSEEFRGALPHSTHIGTYTLPSLNSPDLIREEKGCGEEETERVNRRLDEGDGEWGTTYSS